VAEPFQRGHGGFGGVERGRQVGPQQVRVGHHLECLDPAPVVAHALCERGGLGDDALRGRGIGELEHQSL
jgi:hypothetical protein